MIAELQAHVAELEATVDGKEADSMELRSQLAEQRKLIEANWQPLLITPPFPEYPSGHSTQSGAAAAALEPSRTAGSGPPAGQGRPQADAPGAGRLRGRRGEPG